MTPRHKNQSRKDHEAAPQPVQIPILKQILHPQFFLGGVQPTEDGGKAVSFLIPNGESLIFPLSPDAAKALGNALLAPSVEIARPGDVPSAPPNGSAA